MWVRSVAKLQLPIVYKRCCLSDSKQRMLGPSSHQLLQPHTPNQLCTLRGFRMEQNRILALRAEVFIRMISMMLIFPPQKV